MGKGTLAGFLTNFEIIGNQYAFYFITVGAAIVCGILAGIFSFCTRSVTNDFRTTKMFSPDYGLCNNPTGKI